MVGMGKNEILITKYGEMLDMINCLAIYNGNAEEKPKIKHYSFEEIIEWR